ncbi:alpha-D-ribose 1-methylphosphonate 5-triphosphate synthase subunit PhnG [Psychrobacillus insolitus]|uniref:Alpha-D-ribose 1-methylphosphonate 5-triphosphate synthase subunit PhnG n=1 Tax=Psychrobacillus insolitus TaxID=1461 RepID=A0A2W7N372_9BACI|nr:phosphonate C-P lyase system protein PhnG [Psychrobacillus insolitus]PZX03014.1 alpha-D-ribose 1-methylphosphonate 5-triphosphate synthase subunit PhnG [Psychrobacillus insolitus]
MKRRQRTEILIQGDSQLAQQFAESIMETYECREILAPQYGLTMIKMRETAKNSLFYIGEVLITEAKVEINNRIGIGIVVGMKDELAKHLAIIDAAYKADLPETTTWEVQLIKAEKQITKELAKKQAELFETKVSFETMEV